MLEARDDARDIQDVHVEDDDQSEQGVVLEVDRRRERVLFGGERLELRLGAVGRQLRVQGRHVDDLELLRELQAVLDGRLAVGVDDALVLCETSRSRLGPNGLEIEKETTRVMDTSRVDGVKAPCLLYTSPSPRDS